MTAPLDYSHQRKPKIWLRSALLTAGAIGILYVTTFECMYLQRGPAANMAYFIYSENDALDTFCYRFFYPAYWAQSRMFNGSKHNDDREPPVFPPDFDG